MSEVHVKTVHFLRHAQGWHNVAGLEDPVNGYLRDDLVDAELSTLGIEQCASFATSKVITDVELVVVSPMRRTLQTASQCFPHCIDSIPFVAHECIRETTGLHPCDLRLPIDVHKGTHKHVSFDHINDNEDPYYYKYTKCREPKEHVSSRAKEFFKWLHCRPEQEIAVVTHSAFLREVFHSVLQYHSEEEEQLKRDHGHFANCEVKSYKIDFPELKITVL